MEDATTSEKQTFLRQTILDRGYDAEKFVEFLKSKKGEAGADIANWSMKDLREAVRQFLSFNNPESDFFSQEEQVKKSSTIDNQNNKDIFKEDFEEIQKSKTSIDSDLKNKDEKEIEFGLIIPDNLLCKKCDDTELSNVENITIIVDSPKKKEGGFFSKSYLTLEINTKPLQYKVRRRYTDFYWLREKLLIMFNTNIIPRLPKKGKMDGEFYLNKRIRNLEKFLNYLVKDPIIKNSQILFDFLAVEGEEDFVRKKKVYDKIKVNNDIYSKKEINGELKVKVNAKREIFYRNIKNNVAFNETALKKLNANFKYLKTEYQTLIDRISIISSLFNKLFRISRKFLDDNTIAESYKQMQRMFNGISDTMKEQNLFINTDIKEYYKFINGYFSRLKEFTKNVDIHKNNYNKLSKNLISKKIDLYKKGETSKWELAPSDRNNTDLLRNLINDPEAAYKKICFKETNNAINIKKEYGYYLNKIITEYERIRDINAIIHKEKVINYCQKQTEINNKFNNILNEIITTMSNCENEITQHKTSFEGNNIQNSEVIKVDFNDFREKEDNIGKNEKNFYNKYYDIIYDNTDLIKEEIGNKKENDKKEIEIKNEENKDNFQEQKKEEIKEEIKEIEKEDKNKENVIENKNEEVEKEDKNKENLKEYKNEENKDDKKTEKKEENEDNLKEEKKKDEENGEEKKIEDNLKSDKKDEGIKKDKKEEKKDDIKKEIKDDKKVEEIKNDKKEEKKEVKKNEIKDDKKEEEIKKDKKEEKKEIKNEQIKEEKMKEEIKEKMKEKIEKNIKESKEKNLKEEAKQNNEEKKNEIKNEKVNNEKKEEPKKEDNKKDKNDK